MSYCGIYILLSWYILKKADLNIKRKTISLNNVLHDIILEFSQNFLNNGNFQNNGIFYLVSQIHAGQETAIRKIEGQKTVI